MIDSLTATCVLNWYPHLPPALLSIIKRIKKKCGRINKNLIESIINRIISMKKTLVFNPKQTRLFRVR